MIFSVLRETEAITPAEADVRVMAFCFAKLTNFLNKSSASRKLWNRTILRMRPAVSY